MAESNLDPYEDGRRQLTKEVVMSYNERLHGVVKEKTPLSKTQQEAEFITTKCIEMVTQFKNKNDDYGDSFGVQFSKYGPVSALVRMSDKFKRMETLLLGNTNKVADERLEDTLMDMACYCLMTLYELESRK